MDGVAGVTTGERRDQKGIYYRLVSNLKCLCRKHHLLKTFWTGINGWVDQQSANGTVIWTAPTGKTYKTLPGSRLFFPAWHTTTAELPKTTTPAAQPANRGIMMPKRRRTRAAERARRLRQERALNAAHIAELAAKYATNGVAERNKPPPTQCEETVDIWDISQRSVTYDDDPPPF
jgi:hypothetical protein